MSISSTTQTTEEAELACLIVETLNLDVAAESIDPETPIYGEGLGLDSIDMLEIALVVSQRYGVKLRADDENNVQIFKSLRSLSRFIQDHRGA
jgi:acyl carrier protein